MSAASDYIASVDWAKLSHAYGPASDMPQVLADLARKKGTQLQEPMGELCSRVLHQGTIYSASAPTVQALIHLLPAKTAERTMYYGLFSGFADSARMAIEDGPAPPCHAGGDPADGHAIREAFLGARAVFFADLTHPEAELRGFAADVVTAFNDLDAAEAAKIRELYFAETEALVRHSLLAGIIRMGSRQDDWPAFLDRSLREETEPRNRLALRSAQIREAPAAADRTCLDDFVRSFVQTEDDAHYSFGTPTGLAVIALLEPGRQAEVLLQAFKTAQGANFLRVLAERMLRLVFHDQRTGWESVGYSRLNEDGTPPKQPNILGMGIWAVSSLLLMKLAPWYFRWRIRRRKKQKPKGIEMIQYSGPKGSQPEIPQQLDETQKAVLTAFCEKPELWQFRTNLWSLFGLPESADALRRFVAERS